MWIERHQQRIKALLETLEKVPKQHKSLQLFWIEHGGNGVTFNQALKFLKTKGFVVKENDNRQSPYNLTDQGRKYLEGLRA